MTDLLKEIFYFQIIKPNNIFSVSIMSDGVIKLKESVCGKKQEVEKKISSVKLNTFFSDLERLGFYSWPPNFDCCACDDSSWEIMADHEGKKKRCFGVFGFEPDTWPEFLTLVERSIDIKLPL
jgi:hypothetical protein